MISALTFFEPYKFSPAVFTLCLGGLVFYVRGLRRNPATSSGIGQRISYISGVVLIYLVMQTRYDFWSQHMFFIHRIQHLVLHHLGPFLIALAAPQAELSSGTPGWLRRPLAIFWRHRVTQTIYNLIQQPLVASILFVGLIYFWLIPSIHFYAMLSWPLYGLMNWSMAVDGLLFWWMLFNIRPQILPAPRFFLMRIVLLFIIAIPQIVLGAYIALSGNPLYSVYAVCGRIWPLSAAVDQELGGLITWIPAAMMSLFGMLAVLHKWMKSEKRINQNSQDKSRSKDVLQTA